ncbi:hypothetical protein M231_08117, partial [Tremella mesenterica]
TTDQTLEHQNEEELNSLHGKIRQLKSVTIDILDDSTRGNQNLDQMVSTQTIRNIFNAFTCHLSEAASIEPYRYAGCMGPVPDEKSNTFSRLTGSLFSTSRHHSRSVAATSTIRQYRMIAYIVGVVVLLWLILRLWPSGGGSIPAKDIEVEYR